MRGRRIRSTSTRRWPVPVTLSISTLQATSSQEWDCPLGFRNTIFFTATLLLGILVSSGEAKQYGDILVEASSPPNVSRSHGYTEYRVSVSNRSARDRHQVTLSLPQQSYSGGTVTRTITVESSSTVTVSLFTSIALNGNGLGVEID